MAKKGIMYNVVNFLKNSREVKPQIWEEIWGVVRTKAEDETQEQYQQFLQRKVRYCYEGIVILHNN